MKKYPSPYVMPLPELGVWSHSISLAPDQQVPSPTSSAWSAIQVCPSSQEVTKRPKWPCAINAGTNAVPVELLALEVLLELDELLELEEVFEIDELLELEELLEELLELDELFEFSLPPPHAEMAMDINNENMIFGNRVEADFNDRW